MTRLCPSHRRHLSSYTALDCATYLVAVASSSDVECLVVYYAQLAAHMRMLGCACVALNHTLQRPQCLDVIVLANGSLSTCFLPLFSQSAANVEAGTSAAGLLIDGTRALFGGTRAQGLRAGTSRFLEQGWFVGWKVTMALYCNIWAAWWDRGEDIELRIFLATWTHMIATACEYPQSLVCELVLVRHAYG